MFIETRSLFTIEFFGVSPFTFQFYFQGELPFELEKLETPSFKQIKDEAFYYRTAAFMNSHTDGLSEEQISFLGKLMLNFYTGGFYWKNLLGGFRITRHNDILNFVYEKEGE